MSTTVRSITFGGKSWDFDAVDGNIVITECAGPFGLPVRNMHIPVEIARSFEKALIATAKTISPERKRK